MRKKKRLNIWFCFLVVACAHHASKRNASKKGLICADDDVNSILIFYQVSSVLLDFEKMAKILKENSAEKNVEQTMSFLYAISK